MSAERPLNLNLDQSKPQMSDEQRKIRSENATSRWQNPEFRQKTVKAISESIKEKWKNPEYRKKASKASSKRMRTKWQDPEYKERLSLIHKLKWQDPEYRAGRTSVGINQINRTLWEAAQDQNIIPQILEQGLIEREELLILEKGFSTKRPKKKITDELMDKFSIAVAKVA